MDITKMTAAQRAELKAQLEAEERAEKQKREDDIAAYKDSVDEFCRGKFARLQALSEEMRRAKEEVFGDAERLIALKEELFRTKSDRHSNQFTTSDGSITVALGYRTNDGWDDTVNAGVDKVKTFIRSLAKDDDSAALTEMVMNLLAKDRKGNLKASPRAATTGDSPQVGLSRNLSRRPTSSRAPIGLWIRASSSRCPTRTRRG